MENPQEVLRECLEKFSTPDYIMEPGIFSQLKRYKKLKKTNTFFYFSKAESFLYYLRFLNIELTAFSY